MMADVSLQHLYDSLLELSIARQKSQFLTRNCHYEMPVKHMLSEVRARNCITFVLKGLSMQCNVVKTFGSASLATGMQLQSYS